MVPDPQLDQQGHPQDHSLHQARLYINPKTMLTVDCKVTEQRSSANMC
jgi:hypothetical protein